MLSSSPGARGARLEGVAPWQGGRAQCRLANRECARERHGDDDPIAVVASWYAKNLPREQATSRYDRYFHQNRRRLMNRLDSASVDTSAIEAVDAVWESLLARALGDAS